MLTLSHFTASLFASLLDSLALLAVKVGLLRGAHVQYIPGTPWRRPDMWTTADSWDLQFWGFEVVVDR